MPNNDFSRLINSRRSYLVATEICVLFVVNILVSWLRFEMDLRAVFFEYPAIPKIFVYPLFWYISISIVHGWDRSIIPYGNELFSRALSASWRSLFLFATFAYLIKFPISRIWVAANILASTIAILLVRYLVRRSVDRRYREEGALRYLYVGDESSVATSVSEFRSNFGFAPSIFVMAPPSDGDRDRWIGEYRRKLKEDSINGVIVGYGQIGDASLLKEISDIDRHRVIEFILISRIAPLVHRFEPLENPTLVRVQDSRIVGSGAVIKRMFDICFASFFVLALTPLLIVIGILIKLTSRGPVLYVDKRVGKNGQEFVFPKFRSMYQGSDKKRLEVLGRPDPQMIERYKKDPRITPFGRFIRRWSIDELPQLWCVLIGTMSVVGPRPILREELNQIKSDFQYRFIAKPGLTGLWQVTGRKEVAWEDRMLRDIAYIEEWSFLKDLVLILKTVSAIISGRGAV